jgi:transcriptional regulator with XRE-family HTH domain
MYYSAVKSHCQGGFEKKLGEFSSRYKCLKEANGYTYSKIANVLGLKERQVKAYAAGESKPDYYGLIALAELFDVSLDYLTGRTNKREVNR